MDRTVLDDIFGRERASTRTMAVMHYVDGMTLEEVAGHVGLSVSGVRKRLRTLKLKLFFSSGSELNAIEMLVQVVWMNTQLGEGEKHYRSGVKFTNISPEDMTKLKNFTVSLS